MAQIKTYISFTVEPCLTSHGLTPAVLTATASDGSVIIIPMPDDPEIAQTNTPAPPTNLPANALYVLDRYAVSDQFYHELAQVCKAHH